MPLVSVMIAQTAAPAEPGLFTYFIQSNFAGQVIIFALAFFSLVAWTIMFGKFFELRRLREFNHAFANRIAPEPSLLNLGESYRNMRTVPYADLLAEGLEAFGRAAEFRHSQGGGDRRAELEHAENALQRAVARLTLQYESSMVMLASIISGAPFFGLLGTVWGVMDAFGAVGLLASATIQTLAPGVSGALLTTVAGLLVAIPSLFGYNLLVVRTRQMITELENYASQLADRLELEAG
jgi:biopolymer transport protein TolQ